MEPTYYDEFKCNSLTKTDKVLDFTFKLSNTFDLVAIIGYDKDNILTYELKLMRDGYSYETLRLPISDVSLSTINQYIDIDHSILRIFPKSPNSNDTFQLGLFLGVGGGHKRIIETYISYDHISTKMTYSGLIGRTVDYKSSDEPNISNSKDYNSFIRLIKLIHKDSI